MPNGNPYPVFPASGPGAPPSPEGYGSKHADFSTANPYPLVGDEGKQHLPSPSSVGTKHAQGAGHASNPYPVHGFQYALEKAVGGSTMSHFQSGDIRSASDTAGQKVVEKVSMKDRVSAVGAAMKARMQKQSQANRKSRMFAEGPSKKGSKAGGPAKDAARRHAGSQADVNSASTGY